MKKYLLAAILAVSANSLMAQNNTPNDTVGIFAVANDTVVRINKITHQAIKGSGGLASVATFGAAKIKAKMEFKGATSPHQFDKTATLRLYFGQPPIQQIQALYMFTPNYTIEDFDVARFDVKKGKRLLTGVSTNIVGSTVGVQSADDMQIETKELRPNVYEIIVSGKPGEYCIMFTGNGTGGFGGVFDFTIK